MKQFLPELFYRFFNRKCKKLQKMHQFYLWTRFASPPDENVHFGKQGKISVNFHSDQMCMKSIIKWGPIISLDALPFPANKFSIRILCFFSPLRGIFNWKREITTRKYGSMHSTQEIQSRGLKIQIGKGFFLEDDRSGLETVLMYIVSNLWKKCIYYPLRNYFLVSFNTLQA